MPRGADHLRGMLLATLGILALSPDSLLVRMIRADAFTLLFWRGALLCLVLGAGVVLRQRQVLAPLLLLGRAGWLAAALLACSTHCFVHALRYTTVANTLIIIGAGPLVAALLGRAFLRDPIPLRTWLAMVAAGGGIALTVSADPGTGRWVGNLCACGTAVSAAAYLVVLRRARARSMTPAVAMGGLLAAVVAWPWSQPLGVSEADWLYLALLGGLVLPLSFYLIALAPRYLPAPEVSLIMLLEIVLGPYWVWMVLGETPEVVAVIGGGVVVVTLALHAIAGLRAQAA